MTKLNKFECLGILQGHTK